MKDFVFLLSAALFCMMQEWVLRMLKERCKSRLFGLLNAAVMMLWIVAAAYLAFFGRAYNIERHIEWIPFRGYTNAHWFGSGGFIMNILVFVPFGITLKGCGLRFRYALLIGCLFSMGIEAAQYIFAKGYCELNDLIANATGTMLGWLLMYHGINRNEKMKKDN